MDKKYFLILDSSAILYRAYYALPKLKTKKGQLINAIYGFLLVFLKSVKDFHPAYIAATFDFPAPTFRKKIYNEYKATRKKMPDELKSQIPVVKKILSIFGIPLLEKKGYEADDIIATLSSHFKESDIQKIILTGDQDLLQLIQPDTSVYLFKAGIKKVKLWDEGSLREEYHLTPEEILDFKALRGDSSDNIPGVPGIGPKTAIDLIKKFGSLEGIYHALEKNNLDVHSLLRDKLKKYKNQAFLSKKLASLQKNLTINLDLKRYQWGSYKKEDIIQMFRELGFDSLIKRLDNLREIPQKGDNLKLL